MPRTKSMSRGANGNGTIRKKTVTKNGKETPIGRPAAPWVMTLGLESKFKNPLPERRRKKSLKS